MPNIYSFGDHIYIENPEMALANVEIFNVLGQKIDHYQSVDEKLIQIKIASGTGYYLVKFQTSTSIVTNKVFIK